MSALPPNIVGSFAQSAVQQTDASRSQDAAQNRRAEQSRAMAAQSERATSAVEDADSDTNVHDNAAGTGGQGRAFSDQDEQETPEQADNGITVDDDGNAHLDLEA